MADETVYVQTGPSSSMKFHSQAEADAYCAAHPEYVPERRAVVPDAVSSKAVHPDEVEDKAVAGPRRVARKQVD